MSGALVFEAALRAVRVLNVTEPAYGDIVAVLDAGRPGPLSLFYEAGIDANLPRETLLGRAAALFLSFCAGNLADDLVTGDCDYLAEPVRHGPGTQYLLQNAFVATALEAGVKPSELQSALTELAASSAHHQSQVRVSTWTAGTYKSIAEGIATRQYVGYLSLLWAGTALAERAREVGLLLAIPSMVVAATQSRDSRLFSMTAAERREILDWAREHLGRARSAGLRFVSLTTPALELALKSDP